jgi:hypothetical protein
MAALTQARWPNRVTIQKTITLPMNSGSGNKVFRGSRVCVNTSTNYLVPFTNGANQIPVGCSLADIDNTSGSAAVNVPVLLDKEVTLQWYDNVTGGNAVSTTVGGGSLFTTVYGYDDHTVTASSANSASRAGRVWDCNSVNGVAVENIDV